MSDTEIVWGEPPSTRRSKTRGVWVERLKPLMENPGEWARVYEGSLGTARSTSGSLRSGKTQIPDGDWDFVSRKTGENTGGIWAVYNGPSSDEDTEEEEVESSMVEDDEDDEDYDFEEDLLESEEFTQTSV